MVRPRIKEWNPLVLSGLVLSMPSLSVLSGPLCLHVCHVVHQLKYDSSPYRPLGQCNLIHLCIRLKQPRQWIEDRITSLPCLYKPPEGSNIQTRLTSPHSPPLIYAPLERPAGRILFFRPILIVSLTSWCTFRHWDCENQVRFWIILISILQKLTSHLGAGRTPQPDRACGERPPPSSLLLPRSAAHGCKCPTWSCI